MPIDIRLVASGNVTTNAASYTTTNATIPSGHIIIGFVHNVIGTGPATLPTLSGGNYVLKEAGTVNFNTIGTPLNRLTLFHGRVTGAQITNMPFTGRFGATSQAGCSIQIYSVSGAWSGVRDDGASAIRQIISGTANATENPSLTFFSPLESTSRSSVLYAFGNDTNPFAGTVETNWVESFDGGFATPTNGTYGGYRTGTIDNTIVVTRGSSDWGGIGIEIRDHQTVFDNNFIAGTTKINPALTPTTSIAGKARVTSAVNTNLVGRARIESPFAYTIGFRRKTKWKTTPPLHKATIDWSKPITRGLYGVWLLNENNGQKAFDLVRHNHGTISGPVWRNEGKGRHLDFSGGSSNLVDIGTFAVVGAELTISCWIFIDSFAVGSRDDRFISKADGTAATNHDFMLGMTNNGADPVLRARFARQTDTVLSDLIIPTGRWVHIAATYWFDGVTNIGRCFVNGVPQTNDTIFGVGQLSFANNANPIYIGNQPTSTTSSPDGKIRNVTIWSRALSNYEIRELFQDPYSYLTDDVVTIPVRIQGSIPENTTANSSISGKSRIQQSFNTSLVGVAKITTQGELITRAITHTGTARIQKNFNTSIVGRASIQVASGVTLWDDFERTSAATLGANWTDVVGGFEIVNNSDARGEALEFSKNLAIHVTPTNTVNQYARLQAHTVNNAFPGVAFRYVDSSSPHYLIDWDVNDLYWTYYPDTASNSGDPGTRNIINGGSNISFTSGNAMGLTIKGTGAATRLRVWYNVTALAPDIDGETWDGNAPDINQLIDGGNTADTGKGIGICSFWATASGETTLERWDAGDIPTAASNTTGQSTQIGKARIQNSYRASQVGVARISINQNTSLTGTARIQKSFNSDIAGQVRIQVNNLTNLIGRARIQTSFSSTIIGRTRIQRTFQTNILGVSRIQKAFTTIISGTSRIQKLLTTSIIGRTRIQRSFNTSISGKSRIQTTFRTSISGVTRIQKAFAASISGTTRIQQSFNSVLTGISRISKSFQTSIVGRASITVLQLNTVTTFITGSARIQKGFTNTQIGVSRIQKGFDTIQTGQVRIQTSYATSQTGKARINGSQTTSITGTAKIVCSHIECGCINFECPEANQSSYITGCARITNTARINQTGIARIQKSFTSTQTGKCRIAITNRTNLIGVARISKSQTTTQAGQSRVQKTFVTVQVGVTRIRFAGDISISGKCRIQKTLTNSIIGYANILAAGFTTGRIYQSGTVRIIGTQNTSQIGVARIQKAVVTIQTGKSRIANSFTSNLTGKTRIAVSGQTNETGIVRIQKVFAQTLTGSSRIRFGGISYQSGKSRITNSIRTSISGTVKIKNSVENSISGTSRIIVENNQVEIRLGFNPSSTINSRIGASTGGTRTKVGIRSTKTSVN
jgi:hypothetical protein